MTNIPMTIFKKFKFIALFFIAVIYISASGCGSLTKPVDILNTDEMATEEMATSDTDIFMLAEELVQLSKEKKDASAIYAKLEAIPQETLFATLNTDEKKKAFWMNVYNATVQIFLTKNPELFEDRDAFFKKDRIVVAGENLSLDKIEHGIIRGSKIKLSLGLLKNPFVGKFERKTRVETTDGRIHFALNCGAKSCPYVAIYDYKKLDEQLEKGASQYLKKSTKVEGDVAKVSTLFNWFRGDFGSKQDVVDFNKRLGAIAQDKKIETVEYLPYDWTLELGNFKEL